MGKISPISRIIANQKEAEFKEPRIGENLEYSANLSSRSFEIPAVRDSRNFGAILSSPNYHSSCKLSLHFKSPKINSFYLNALISIAFNVLPLAASIFIIPHTLIADISVDQIFVPKFIFIEQKFPPLAPVEAPIYICINLNNKLRARPAH